MTAPLIECRQLSKTYRRGPETIEVLQQLDLNIPEGDFVALMGPSGSGKTTLLNLIGGLDQPSGGEIRIGGQRIDQLSSAGLSRWRAEHVGFVFQFYNLMPVLSAARNVELPLLLTNLSKADRQRRVDVALKLVGLAERDYLSGSLPQIGGSGEIENTHLGPIERALSPALKQLAKQIRSSIDFFADQQACGRPERLEVLGETDHLQGIRTWLGSVLGERSEHVPVNVSLGQCGDCGYL